MEPRSSSTTMPPWGVSLAWRRHEGILEADLGLVAAPHDGAFADVVLHAGSVTLARARRSGAARARRAAPACDAACSPVASVAASAALALVKRRGGLRRSAGRCATPTEEEVEHHQEPELQADGDRLDHHRRHSVDLEARVDRAHFDAVAGLQRLGLVGAQVAPVDAHAVGRPQVGDHAVQRLDDAHQRGRGAGSGGPGNGGAGADGAVPGTPASQTTIQEA